MLWHDVKQCSDKVWYVIKLHDNNMIPYVMIDNVKYDSTSYDIAWHDKK